MSIAFDAVKLGATFLTLDTDIMRVADFSFDLPDELIARFPKHDRTSSRLLTLDGPSGELEHKVFSDILALVNENDLLVFNNTKVIPARMYGQKESGGKVEVLVERVLDEHRVLAHIRASKSPKVGATLTLEGKAHNICIQGQKSRAKFNCIKRLL